MHFEYLPTEVIAQIFHSCYSITDALNLGATCQHFQKIVKSSRRLPILYTAAETEFGMSAVQGHPAFSLVQGTVLTRRCGIGPLHDATSLATFTTFQTSYRPSQPPPQSLALLTRLLVLGRVANAWVSIYPFYKWSSESSASRRSLSETEKYILRRACYRLWLFATAWHTSQHPRITRNLPTTVQYRASMLRSWSTTELAEMQDLQTILRAILSEHVCPSNGTVLRRYKERFPHIAPGSGSTLQVRSLSNVSIDKLAQHFEDFSLQSTIPTYRHRHGARKCSSLRCRYPIIEGWGDEISHYYLLEDMLKLNPQQILELYQLVESADEESCQCHPSVAQQVENKLTQWYCSADWFENNGETFAGTVQIVVNDRGGEYDLFRDAIELGHQGVVKDASCAPAVSEVED